MYPDYERWFFVYGIHSLWNYRAEGAFTVTASPPGTRNLRLSAQRSRHSGSLTADKKILQHRMFPKLFLKMPDGQINTFRASFYFQRTEKYFSEKHFFDDVFLDFSDFLDFFSTFFKLCLSYLIPNPCNLFLPPGSSSFGPEHQLSRHKFPLCLMSNGLRRTQCPAGLYLD